MMPKNTRGILTLVFLVFFYFSALLSPGRLLAQTQPSGDPIPTPTPACLDTFDGEPGQMSDWVYDIGGGSRTRTWQVGTFDTETEQFCGFREVSETEYAWCVSGVDSQDGFGTFWYPQGQEPQGATPGQCPSHRQTTTICFNGETIEVEIELLGRYEGYTEGACAVSTPTPPSCSGTQHLNADRSKCVDFDMPGGGDSGGGTTSTGQVLGASTLAATGDASSRLGIILMLAGLGISLSSLYVFARKFVR